MPYGDPEHFKSPEHWWFDRFRVFPPKETIEQALEKEIFDFWNLPGSNEEETVRRLLIEETNNLESDINTGITGELTA